MAGRLAFSIDLDRCIGCRACVVACAAGNEIPPGETFIAVSEVVRRVGGGLWGSFFHHRCFHCGDAACVRVCPTGTLSKWSGLTVVAGERCSGCGYCTDACPFEVPHVRGGEVSKCLGCAEQLGAGQAPWCERTCPTEAIRVGERESVLAQARERAAALRGCYPAAQVYGDAALGGLGLLLVLLDRPGAYGLPEKPEAPAALAAWKATQPVAVGISAAAAVGMGLLLAVSRRRHLQEMGEGGRPAEPEPPAGKGGDPGP